MLAREAGLSVIADARIDNRDELRDTLALPSGGSDAALILAAYRRWGTDSATHLIGDFAFCVVDDHTRTLLAACDPMNMRPLYHAGKGGLLAFGTRLNDLLHALGMPPRLERAAICDWLVGRPDPGASMLSNVERLRPGHLLQASAGRRAIRRFWNLRPDKQIRYQRPGEYVEHLESLLARCVTDRLPDRDEAVASQLSGGMDSTSVTALAWRARKDTPTGLLAVSHTYPDCGACDERDLIGDSARFLGLKDHLFIPTASDIELDYRALYPPAFDSPGTVVSPRYIEELKQIRARGARVMLTGSGGDEMAWGHSLSYSRRLLHGDLGVLAEVMRGSRELGLPVLATLLQLFLKPLLPERLLRLRRRLRDDRPWPDWIPERAARELDLEERLRPPPAHFRNPVLQARYEALRDSSTYHSVRSYATAGEVIGVDIRHPFFDRRLAEFSFAIPDDLWLRERYPKWLLRKTMSGKLPDSVVWNRHKVVFDTFFASLIKHQQETIFSILSHPGLQDLGLLDNRKLLAAFHAVLANDPPSVTVELLHALMVQIWFQRHAERFGY